MGPDLELQGKKEAALDSLEDKTVKHTIDQKSNATGTAALLGQPILSDGDEDIEANITDFANFAHPSPVKDAHDDDTESSSSSFGCTESETENLDDNDLESHFIDNASAFLRRKKKLTDHWRRFIHPIRWRSKWMELQLMMIKSQTLKYERELAELDHIKKVEVEKYIDGYGSRSIPFSDRHHQKIMERKKRKKVEEVVDVASYISDHKVFSYIENKKAGNGVRFEADLLNLNLDKAVNGNDLKIEDTWSSLKLNDSDKSLEEIIQKIEAALSQVHILKSRIDKVLSENHGKFSSINKLSTIAPCAASTQSNQNAAYNSERFSVGDLLIPEHVIQNHGKVVPLVDIIKSTDQSQLVDTWGYSQDGVLIHNPAAKEELHDFEKLQGQLVEKPDLPDQKIALPAQVIEPDMIGGTNPSMQYTVKPQPASKSNFPRNKRKKRGKKKLGSKTWSRKPSG